MNNISIWSELNSGIAKRTSPLYFLITKGILQDLNDYFQLTLWDIEKILSDLINFPVKAAIITESKDKLWCKEHDDINFRINLFQNGKYCGYRLTIEETKSKNFKVLY